MDGPLKEVSTLKKKKHLSGLKRQLSPVLLAKLVVIFGCNILLLFPVHQPNINKIPPTSKKAKKLSFTHISN
jgi:hypothetical protein